MEILAYIIRCLLLVLEAIGSPSGEGSFIDFLVGCIIVCIAVVWWFSSINTAGYLTTKVSSNKFLTTILAIVIIAGKIVLFVGLLMKNTNVPKNVF